MKKSRIPLTLVLLIATTLCVRAESSDCAPQLGDSFIVSDRSNLLMISSGQVSPHAEVRRNGIAYTLAVDAGDKVIYVSSRDPDFSTPEGLSTRSTLDQVLASGGVPLMNEAGWGFYSRLPSGWCAAFFIEGVGAHGSPLVAPIGSSQVSAFFKRGSAQEVKTAQPGATDNPDDAQ